jgi:hypothetical protein
MGLIDDDAIGGVLGKDRNCKDAFCRNLACRNLSQELGLKNWLEELA